MSRELPFDALHEALAAACLRDLPDIEYNDRDWTAWSKYSKEEQTKAFKENTLPTIKKKRRPTPRDVEIWLFNQSWGDTALGYGGMAGQAFTDAYTVVISDMRNVCVYFGCGRLAYRLNWDTMSEKGRNAYREDLASFNMAHVADSGKYK
jgi:predicted Fe-S protein YdhL (DUF1289 family)